MSKPERGRACSNAMTNALLLQCSLPPSPWPLPLVLHHEAPLKNGGTAQGLVSLDEDSGLSSMDNKTNDLRQFIQTLSLHSFPPL